MSNPAIRASLLRLRLRSPFFATLALHASFIPRPDIDTAATDGLDILYNPDFLASLPPAQVDGLLLHEVLHAALEHVFRRRHRDAEQWNIAADIVVNGLLAENGFEIPDGGIRDHQLERYSVEEVFALLGRDRRGHTMEHPDLLGDGRSDGRGERRGDRPGRGPGERGADSGGDGATGRADRSRTLERDGRARWQRATAQAAALAREGRGSLPAGVERTFGIGGGDPLPWRTLLWRFLTPTQADFGAFDRRHIHSGLYLETLQDEGARVWVAVDTSGSIDDGQIGAFVSEVRAIVRAYPSVEGWLWYADAEVYGPYALHRDAELPPPTGGGGTDFCPFFAAVAHESTTTPTSGAVCVYLTDGYGSFPEEPPDVPVLWVVVAGGLADDQFPFGTVVRMT